MPIPLPLALLLLAGGTYGTIRSNQMRDEANAGVMELLGKRLRENSDRANQLFEESLSEQDIGTQTELIDTAKDEKIGRVEQLLADNPLAPRLPGQDSASRVVTDSVNSSLSQSIAKARAQLAAQAELEGFGGRTFERGLQLRRRAPEFTDLAANARGDRQLAETGFMAAATKGQKQGIIGDVLTSLALMGLSLPAKGATEASKAATLIDTPVFGLPQGVPTQVFA